jgi:hypothetical protein
LQGRYRPLARMQFAQNHQSMLICQRFQPLGFNIGLCLATDFWAGLPESPDITGDTADLCVASRRRPWLCVFDHDEVALTQAERSVCTKNASYPGSTSCARSTQCPERLVNNETSLFNLLTREAGRGRKQGRKREILSSQLRKLRARLSGMTQSALTLKALGTAGADTRRSWRNSI